MHSLRFRLLSTFIFIGLTPYFLIVAYFTYWENNKIIEDVKKNYSAKAEHSKKLIDHTLLALDEEITFLSRLELLDDMISDDADLQISRLLEQKSSKADEKYMELYALDLNHQVIASSQMSLLNKKLLLSNESYKKSHFIFDKALYFIKPIYASFDARALGYLVAKFDIKHLNQYLLSDEVVLFKIEEIDSNKVAMSEDAFYYYGYLEFSSYLKGFEIRYIIDKEASLSHIDDFLFYLSMITLFGMLVIVFVSRKMTTLISRPIIELKETAKQIVRTKDFHLRIEPSHIDEFKDLGKSFNKLFESTQTLVDKLELENETRLKNYIDLSETFNAISQAKSHDETLALSRSALEENTNSDNSLEIIFFNSVQLMQKNQLEKLSLLEKINSASSAKTDFISAMSHELRTPLNAIIGYSQYMISYEELEDDQVDTIAKIETSAYHLLNIINDILDIAKIEAGKTEKKIISMSPYCALRETLDIMETLAEDKGLELIVDIDEIEDLVIDSDVKIFKQIVINLMSNSIKFTNEGYLVLRAHIEENVLVIEVEDSGIGIKHKDLEKIFDEFTQLKNAKKSQDKGSGLGLSLCKHLSREIGAQIGMRSEGLGKGSSAQLRFKLT